MVGRGAYSGTKGGFGRGEALCAELDAYEKTDGDLMTWFAGQMGLSV